MILSWVFVRLGSVSYSSFWELHITSTATVVTCLHICIGTEADECTGSWEFSVELVLSLCYQQKLKEKAFKLLLFQTQSLQLQSRLLLTNLLELTRGPQATTDLRASFGV